MVEETALAEETAVAVEGSNEVVHGGERGEGFGES